MRALIVVALVLAPALGHAEEPAAREHQVSATFSPVHLIITTFEVNGELRVAPHMGASVIGGYGRFDSDGIDVTVYELGGQFSYYFLAPFSGLHAGVEAIYAHANATSDSAVFADGVTVGPYGGYKWIASFGLTLVAQLGGQYLAIEGSNAESEQRLGLLLNLNAGWSF